LRKRGRRRRGRRRRGARRRGARRRGARRRGARRRGARRRGARRRVCGPHLAEESAEEQEETAHARQRRVVARERLRKEALGVAEVGVRLARAAVAVAVGDPHGQRAVCGAALQRGAYGLVEVLGHAGAEAVLAVELDLEQVPLRRVVLEQARSVLQDAAARHARQVRRDGADAHAVHAPLRLVHLATPRHVTSASCSYRRYSLRAPAAWHTGSRKLPT
jgi:hypothetical protein